MAALALVKLPRARVADGVEEVDVEEDSVILSSNLCCYEGEQTLQGICTAAGKVLSDHVEFPKSKEFQLVFEQNV